MQVYSRWESAVPFVCPALLLEGVWRPAIVRNVKAGATWWSLDDLVDARLAHLDVAAVELAEQAGGVHTLRLRYFLLKLLRAAWFFRQGPGRATPRIDLHLTRARDEDYASLFQALAAAGGPEVQLHWRQGAPAADVQPPVDAFWRQALGKLLTTQCSGPAPGRRPNVVLMGDARRLDGVCATLVRRGYSPWWLYERFAVRTWWRWRGQGVRQIVLNGNPGGFHEVGASHRPPEPGPLLWEGVDLAPAVRVWQNRAPQPSAARDVRLSERVTAVVEKVGPAAIVLDEDATPLARTAVNCGKRLGIPSLVVQHGAPCVRFGFAAPLADVTCVWGEASRRQLLRWGARPDQIRVTGFPALPAPRRRPRRAPGRTMRVLLLGTVPPRNDRPDAAEFCLTTDRYAQMLAGVCAALASLAQRLADPAEPLPFRRVQLWVRPHPRSPHDPILAAALRAYPQLRPRLVRRGGLLRHAARAHLAIGCASSSVVEAAQAGAATIQLMPVGSAREVFEPAEWGLNATCRSPAELQAALGRLLPALAAKECWATSGPSQAVAACGVVAAENVVRELRNLIARHDGADGQPCDREISRRLLETAG